MSQDKYTPLISQTRNTGLYPSSLLNTAARAATFSAVAIEPLYSAFLYQSARDAAEEALKIFGVAVTDEIRFYIQLIAVPFAVANLACDLTSVDAFREADGLTAPTTTSGQSQQTALSKKLLGLFLKLLAVLISFPAGASADAIPIATFVAQSLSGIPAQVVDYSTLAFVTTLGVIYYAMFTNARIQRHADELIDTLKNLPEFGKNLAHNSGAYLEVLIQTISNAFYRGVSFMYIWGEAAKEALNAPKEGAFNKTSSFITGLTTFFITLMSRTLSTRDKFLNEKFKTLTPQEINKAPKIWPAYAFDLLLSAARGTSVGYILNEQLKSTHTPPLEYETERWLRVAGCTLLALVLLMHSAKIRYDAGRKALALSLKSASNNTDTSKTQTETDPIKKAIAQFDEIAQSYNSPGFNLLIDVANTMARLVRFLAFLLFVETINSVFLGNYFSDSAVIALTALWGLEVFKNDGDVYRESIKETCQGHIAKWNLQKIRHPDSCWAAFANGARALFSSPYNYSKDEIQRLHDKTFATPELEDGKKYNAPSYGSTSPVN